MARSLTPEQALPSYSAEEQRVILDSLLSSRSGQIREFLERHGLQKSGTKTELRKRIVDGLRVGDLTYPDVVQYVDEIEPWGKQHVFLYSGPEGKAIENWRNGDWVKRHLDRHSLGPFFNAHLPLILPPALALSSIRLSNRTLRIFAVEKREYWERDSEHDETRDTETGEQVELRAFVRRVKRGVVIFEWEMTSNNAMLQITQLPSGTRYETVWDRFRTLVGSWFDLDWFSLLDVSHVISKLHRAEENGSPEARSHAIDYSSIGGRRLSGRSPTATDSLLGETVIDQAMRNVRDQGVGHLGNFYWLPKHISPAYGNPLQKELHVHVVGSRGRIGFSTPNEEVDVRYVLSRVRALSV